MASTPAPDGTRLAAMFMNDDFRPVIDAVEVRANEVDSDFTAASSSAFRPQMKREPSFARFGIRQDVQKMFFGSTAASP